MKLTSNLFAFVILGAACGKSGPQAQSQQISQKPEKVKVQTQKVVEKLMPRTLRLTGTLKGEQEADVAANAAGKIVQTFVERGEEVKGGRPLAKLDTTAIALSADEAKANAELTHLQSETAKRDCARYEELYQTQAISKADYDRMVDQCKLAPLSAAAGAARAEAAAQSVRDSLIRAPFSGVVAERYVEVGQFVQRDSKVARVVKVDRLRLEFTVPEVQLGLIRKDSPVHFSVAAYPDKTFEGVVRFVGAAVRNSTRDVVVEAEIENRERVLLPGMFATLELTTSQVSTAVVSSSSLVKCESRTCAFVVVNRRIEERVVQPGLEQAGTVAILDGLRLGEEVVVGPSADLRNGIWVD